MVEFGHATRHDTNNHASLRPASAQVSSRFRAGFGPASIMDFGLNEANGGYHKEMDYFSRHQY